MTNLCLLAAQGDTNKVKSILESIRDEPDQTDVLNVRIGGDKLTPLHSAVLANHNDIVTLLCEEGADVDLGDVHGDTALHSAAGLAQVDVLETLLNHGANVSFADEDGMTPFHAAVVEGHPSVVALMAEKGASHEVKRGLSLTCKDGLAPLHFAAISGHIECIKVLIEAGADLNVHDDRTGARPLHYMTSHGTPKSIREFLELGKGRIDVNAIDNEGRTALLLACLQKKPKMAAALISHGSNVDAKDDVGRSPNKDFPTIIKDAKTLAVFHKKRTPLIMGNVVIVVLLMMFLINARPFKLLQEWFGFDIRRFF